jgi:hypothetical protein
LYLRIRSLLRPIMLAATSFLCVSVLGSSGSSELEAQEAKFRPHAGLYLPTRISTQDGVLHIRQKIGLALGARLTLTFSKRFDVVSGITYMPGYVAFHRSGERLDVGTASHSLSVTTGARYWLLQPSRRMLSWEVHTSLGIGAGGRAAYRDLFESSLLTGVLGTAVRYQIGQIVSFTLKVQQRLCRVRLGHGGDAGSSRSPLDVSFGLDLPFLESLR